MLRAVSKRRGIFYAHSKAPVFQKDGGFDLATL